MSRTEQHAPEPADDAGVIERSLRIPEQFGVIFDRHAPYIHRYLARRLGTAVAEDLTAETFLVAFRKRDRYDRERRDARPWLYGIATNLVAQHRRDEVRQFRLHQVMGPAPDESCHADRVAAIATAQATRQELHTALATLSSADRDALLLVAWEQLTYEEVAAALGIPVGTVRSRLNRARRKVREALGGSDLTTDLEEESS
ncbi:RNA polymerase sigma-70 factor, ECF subfamily [Asanoa hainanensis]|uniref:RNA polymerase sigma-70 factor, ECF subfamily n=1 Tax=Asanoa hainanensis TaxID=560556 RepID=A0A239MZM9_9ACTN|nr:RNA polymerase sigma factor [Asanoa hainanensis]SNT47960.1 RNA polymerase sigma-70 factor, ECF subfamily [Asanoa hainanensis]